MEKKIVVELEAKTDNAIDDIKKLNKELDNTSKSSKDASDRLNGLNNTSKSLDSSSNSARKLASSLEEVKDNGGAIAILDALTGGLATRFRDAYEATKLFNFSLNSMKKTLISTGIGALVVALGTIVAYWDDITNFIEGVNRKLKYQEENLNKQLKIQTLQLDLLKQQIAIEELRNGFSPKLTAEYKKQLLIQREQNIALLENLQTQLNIEESKNKEVTLWEKIKIAAAGQFGYSLQGEQIAKSINETSEESLEIQEKLNEAKRKTGAIDLELAQIDKAAADRKKEEEKKKEEEEKKKKESSDKDVLKEKEKQDAIDKIQKDYIKRKEDRDADTELKKINLEEQRTLAELERLGATNEQKLEVQKYYNQLRNEVTEEQNKKQLEDAEKLNEQLAQAETNLQQAKANAIRGGLQIIGQLGNKSKALAKTLLVVEKGLAIAQVISSAASAIAKAKANLAATPAVIGVVPNPMYAVQAVATAKGILATKLAAGTSIATIAAQAIQGVGGSGGGGAGSLGGVGSVGGGSTISQPPAFNVVGASDTNQLANAIGGQSQQPVRAYVVSNDVTTAQSMDRNIVDEASI